MATSLAAAIRERVAEYLSEAATLKACMASWRVNRQSPGGGGV